MRIIGIDHGDARIGVSVSDPMQKMAFGSGVIENKGIDHISGQLGEIISKYGDVGEIVVGMPVGLKGIKGPQTEKIERFITELSGKITVPIKTFDERLTTAESAKFFSNAGINTRKMKKIIDEASAMRILQGYLDRRKK